MTHLHVCAQHAFAGADALARRGEHAASVAAFEALDASSLPDSHGATVREPSNTRERATRKNTIASPPQAHFNHGLSLRGSRRPSPNDSKRFTFRYLLITQSFQVQFGRSIV